MSASLTSTASEAAMWTGLVTPFNSASMIIEDPSVSKARLSPQAISKNAMEELGRYLSEKSAVMVLRYLDRFVSKATTKAPGCYSVDAQRRLVIDSERLLEELEDTFADLPADFYENFQGSAIGEWAMPKALDAYIQMKWTSFQGSLANTGQSGDRSSHTYHHHSDSDDDSDDSGDEFEQSGGYLKPSKQFTQEEAGMLEEMIANGTAGKEQVLRLSRQVSDKRWQHPGGKARNPKLQNDEDADDDDSDTDEDEDSKWSVQRYQEEHNARRKGRLSVDNGVTL